MTQGYPPPPAQPPPKQGLSAAAIVLILGVLAAFGFAGCAVCVCVGAQGARAVKEGADKRKAERQAEAAATRAARESPTPTTAKAMLAAYKANEVAADQTYKGHYFRVTGGIVREIRKDFRDRAEVWVNSTGKPLEYPEIVCNLKPEQVSVAAAVKKGQKVIIIGRANGMLIQAVQLDDCELVAL